MGAFFKFELITPERRVVAKDVEMIVASGAEGYFGVLPGHCPFLSALKPGPLVIGSGLEAEQYILSNGFAQVVDNRMVVLVDQATQTRNIDRAKSQAEVEMANRKLDTLSSEDPEYQGWTNRLEFAKACLKALEKQGKSDH
ncbi:MAG: ATP synthase F1 subunit epsilon [Magnetococcales bacterium]|nr:ATP synthase F1 subunit epsilon [Magnetococcales bacterium]